MKKSNIIILASIGFIIVTNIWMAVDAKNKFNSFLDENNSTISDEIQEINIDPFSHIVISNNAKVFLYLDNKNTYSKLDKNKQQIKINNDTLYISDDTRINLTCNNIESIKLLDEAEIITQKFEGSYLKLTVLGNSQFNAQNQNFHKLDIYSKEDARISIYNSNIDTCNILTLERSVVGLGGQLDIVRGEAKDDSRLTVSGANNTQFSKSKNAFISMY